MNERIQELAREAGIYAKPRQVDETPIINTGMLTPHRTYVSDQKYIQDNFDVVRSVLDGYGLEKFAELIVGECMNLALTEQKRYANITHRNMSECAVALGNFSLLIKDHFEDEE